MKNVKAATLVALIWLVNIFPVSGEVADSINYPHGGSHVRGIGAGVGHLGLDISATANYEYKEANKNDAVYAPCNANIFDSGWHSGYAGTIIAEFVRPDGNKDVWLCGHLDVTTLKGTGQVRKGELIGRVAKNYQQKNNDGHNNKLVDRINLNDDIDWNGEGDAHVHFAIRKGSHPNTWVYPGYSGSYGQTEANFYDPNWYIANYHTFGGGNITPHPDGDTRASLAELSKTDRGEGHWSIAPTCEDRTGKASGVRSIRVWLHIRYRTPEVWIDLGKHFSPNNPARWSTEFIYDVFFRLEEGVYEIYVTTESGDGRLLERQYSGKNIDLNRSTKPPIRIDDKLTPNSNGTTSYWLKSQAEQGRRFVRRMGPWVQAGNRMVPVPPDASGNEYRWLIEPTKLGLAAGRYQLFYYLEDVWGTKTNPPLASNRWFDVTAAPAELPTVTPSHWTQWARGIAIANATMPNYPMKDRIPLTVELGGDNIANLDHWCILVYGNGGNPNSYKAVSAHQSSRSISCIVDTYNLMDGKLTVGALIYVKGDRNGYEIMSHGRLLVDKR